MSISQPGSPDSDSRMYLRPAVSPIPMLDTRVQRLSVVSDGAPVEADVHFDDVQGDILLTEFNSVSASLAAHGDEYEASLPGSTARIFQEDGTIFAHFKKRGAEQSTIFGFRLLESLAPELSGTNLPARTIQRISWNAIRISGECAEIQAVYVCPPSIYAVMALRSAERLIENTR